MVMKELVLSESSEGGFEISLLCGLGYRGCRKGGAHPIAWTPRMPMTR